MRRSPSFANSVAVTVFPSRGVLLGRSSGQMTRREAGLPLLIGITLPLHFLFSPC